MSTTDRHNRSFERPAWNAAALLCACVAWLTPPAAAQLIFPAPKVNGVMVGQVLGLLAGVGETPVGGATVQLVRNGLILATTTTDFSGTFVFESVGPGHYGVHVAADGFAQGNATGAVIAGQVTYLGLVLGRVQPCVDCPFLDVTQSVGLGGYRASTGDGHGPGAVFADLNGDGYPDLYLVRAASHGGSGGPEAANQLYLNIPDPITAGRRFRLQSESLGAGHRGNATGAVAGDYDNDGDQDLFVVNFDQPNVLLQNQWSQTGVLSFVDVTASTDPTPGLADGQFGLGTAVFQGVVLDNSLSAGWADVNRDGYLDLYVGNHNGYVGGPVEGPFAVPGRRDVLYLNAGDGTFWDLTMAKGAPGYSSEQGQFQTDNQRFSSTNAVIFADFNNDRWPDLLVTNKVGGKDDRDMLYLNLGPAGPGAWLGFATATYDLPQAFGFASGAAMGVDVGDFDNDGDFDIYITDVSGLPLEQGLNDLWVNRLAETGELGFALTQSLDAAFSWGTQWQDFDNNGFLDLHVATSATYRDHLYMNTGLAFAEAALPLGLAQVRQSRGDLAADFDRDGQVDLFVVNLSGVPSALYQNRFAGDPANHHFLVVDLVGDPSLSGVWKSSRDAIGARVKVSADLNGDGVIGPDETQMREVVSGNSNAASSSSHDLEFGVGKAVVASIEILWPSGRTSNLSVPVDRFVTIIEQ